MKIFNSNGSKERLFEMMGRVNKININENINEIGGQSLNPINVLNVAFNQLVGKKLNIQQSKTYAGDNESFVELMGIDGEGNNVTFTFKVAGTEGDQDGVYDIDNAILTSFTFDGTSGDVVELDEKGLSQFNMKHKNEIVDIVSDYTDFEENIPEIDEAYLDAVKKIDSYKTSVDEGWKENLVAGTMMTAATLGGMNQAHGTPKFGDKLKNKIEKVGGEIQKTVNGVKDKVADFTNPSHVVDNIKPEKSFTVKNSEPESYKQSYERMSREDGFGQGKSTNYNAARMMAHNNAINNLAQKKTGVVNGNTSTVNAKVGNTRIVDERTYKTADGQYLIYMVLSGNVQDTDVQTPSATMNVKENFVQKDKSYPFGGTPRTMQTSQAYGDEKPTNNNVRVKAPELNKFVDEEVTIGTTGIMGGTPKPITSSTKSQIENIPEEKKKIIKTAINNITVKKGKPEYAPTAAEVQAEINRIKTADKTVKESDETTMSKNVDFMFTTPVKYSGEKAFNTLSPNNKNVVIGIAQRDIDNQLRKSGINVESYMRTNYDEYIDKIKKLALIYFEQEYSRQAVNEEDNYPDPLGKKFKTKSKYPKSKKKPQTTVSIDENGDDEENVEILTKKHDETGEKLKGGLGDDKSPMNFDPEQVSLGIKVEMEHTDDPMEALEIALDHLTEDPEYYTVKDDPEASAQFNAAKDAEEKSEDEPYDSQDDDEEETDELLGFKPKNVGDYEGAEIDEELTTYQQNIVKNLPHQTSTSVPVSLGKSKSANQTTNAPNPPEGKWK